MHKMNKNAHNYAFLSLTHARYPYARVGSGARRSCPRDKNKVALTSRV